MIIEVNKLQKVRIENKNKTIALTSGTFDLFHVGHLAYLTEVKKYGDIVVVLLSGDSRVRARKGSYRPIIKETDRAQILDSLKIVDYVLMDERTDENNPVYKGILSNLNPDYYVTDGPDPRFYNLIERSKFVIVDRMKEEPSTTSIIKRILDSQ